MKILIVGDSEESYLAKYHEAFRTGLRRTFDTRCFGIGYPNFNENISSYQEVVEHVFPDGKPDLIIASIGHDASITGPGKIPYTFPLEGIKSLNIPKAIILSDFWNISEDSLPEYLAWLDLNTVNFVLCYYPHLPIALKNTKYERRFLYVPPCFDPCLFNDWGLEKEYDLGFMGAGIADPDPFYPERETIHKKLIEKTKISYLYKKHPGWGNHDKSHSYVGEGFSRTINTCKTFVTTGGKYNCPYPKFVEIMASKSCLLAITPLGFEALGLIDGQNYISVTTENIEDIVDQTLGNPRLIERIAENGYQHAMKNYSCYARALDFAETIGPAINSTSYYFGRTS